MTPSDWAWIGLAIGVGVWDLSCPKNHTLSEAMTRYHRAKPWLTRLLIAYLVGHLLDWWPRPLDPLTQATRIRHVRRRVTLNQCSSPS